MLSIVFEMSSSVILIRYVQCRQTKATCADGTCSKRRAQYGSYVWYGKIKIPSATTSILLYIQPIYTVYTGRWFIYS